MPDNYGQVQQSRTVVASANTWTAVSIPIGCRYPLLASEDETVSFRVSTDNTITTSQGTYIPATGAYAFEGTNTTALTVYVSTSGACTMILIYTRD